MKRTLATIIAIAAVAAAGAAQAAEVKGIIKSTTDRTVTIDTTQAGQPGAPAGINGNTMELTIPAPPAGGTDMRSGLVPGLTVTFTYTTANGINTVSKVVK